MAKDTTTPKTRKNSANYQILIAMWEANGKKIGYLADSPSVKALIEQCKGKLDPIDYEPATYVTRNDGHFDPGLAAMVIVSRAKARGLNLSSGASGLTPEEVKAEALKRLKAIQDQQKAAQIEAAKAATAKSK